METITALNVVGKQPLGESPAIAATAMIKDCRLGIYTEIMDFVEITESTLGDYSYICRFGAIIYADIGKFSNIASMVRINPGKHPIDWPTLHHFTYRSEEYGFTDSSDESFFNWRRRHRVCIGHDTWIGHGAVIMPGVKIGDGAVVGSMSVVTKDVPPYAIVAGVPARLIRERFPRSIAEELQKISWWDWTHDQLRERLEDFKNLRVFLDKHTE